MKQLYIIINQGSASKYLFKEIEKEMNVIIIPDKLAAPKNLFLKISRFLLVGKFPLPISILCVWFDKALLRSLTAIESTDHLLIFENINPRALGMIKNIIPGKTKVYNWFGNPIYPLFKGKSPQKRLDGIKKMGYELVTFDKEDALQYGLTFHNPFIKLPLEDERTTPEPDIDFFFCGAPKDREAYLLQLKNILEKAGYNCMFIIPHSPSEYISYEENLAYVKRSKCIIDIYQKGQSGLTRRPLEALFYDKKLITNNAQITEYDFYHPDNIFILQSILLKEIQLFMKKSLHSVSLEIKKRYDVHEWLKKFMPDS